MLKITPVGNQHTSVSCFSSSLQTFYHNKKCYGLQNAHVWAQHTIFFLVFYWFLINKDYFYNILVWPHVCMTDYSPIGLSLVRNINCSALIIDEFWLYYKLAVCFYFCYKRIQLLNRKTQDSIINHVLMKFLQ